MRISYLGYGTNHIKAITWICTCVKEYEPLWIIHDNKIVIMTCHCAFMPFNYSRLG